MSFRNLPKEKAEDICAIDDFPPGSPEKVRMVFLEDQLKAQINVEVDKLIAQSRSKVISLETWEERVFVVKNWETGATVNGNDLNVKQFRHAYRKGYKWVSEHRVETNSTGIDALYRKGTVNKKGRKLPDTLVVKPAEIFDVIKHSHVNQASHLKSDRTWNLIQESYHNIPRELVKFYCDICPICNSKQPVVKQYKGAKKPIESLTYRDRFVIDLIDYKEDPQKWDSDDPETEIFRWLLTVKDHLTHLLFAAPLKHKSAKEVARELYKLFSLIGYPLILHADNGSEFTAEDVITNLRKLNPCAFTVHGRPRKPNDQGSIERGNQDIKKTVAAIVQEKRGKNEEASWLTEYPNAIASINATANRGEVSAYHMVFGMSYHEPLRNVIVTDLEGVKTVRDLCKKAGPEFAKKALFLKEVTEADLADPILGENLLASFQEEADDESSSDAKPAAKESSLLSTDNGDASNPKTKPPKQHLCTRRILSDLEQTRSSKDSHTSSQAKASHQKPAILSKIKLSKRQISLKQDLSGGTNSEKPTHSSNNSTSSTYEGVIPPPPIGTCGTHVGRKNKTHLVQLCLAEAFQNCTQRRQLLDGNSCQAIFPRLTCSCAFPNGCTTLSWFDRDYRLRNYKTQRWWESDFVNSYLQILTHSLHPPNKIFLQVYHPNETLEAPMIVQLRESCQEVIAVANYQSQHFAVIRILVNKSKVEVFDGFSYPLTRWTPHILNALKRTKLVKLGATLEDTFQYTVEGETRPHSDSKWLVCGCTMLQQVNGFDCGPIACIVARHLLSDGNRNANSVAPKFWRKDVVQHYQTLFRLNEEQLMITKCKIPSHNPEVIDLAASLEELEMETCPICLGPVDGEDKYEAPCKHQYHMECLLNNVFGYGNFTCCLCRTPLPEELIRGAKDEYEFLPRGLPKGASAGDSTDEFPLWYYDNASDDDIQDTFAIDALASFDSYDGDTSNPNVVRNDTVIDNSGVDTAEDTAERAMQVDNLECASSRAIVSTEESSSGSNTASALPSPENNDASPTSHSSIPNIAIAPESAPSPEDNDASPTSHSSIPNIAIAPERAIATPKIPPQIPFTPPPSKFYSCTPPSGATAGAARALLLFSSTRTETVLQRDSQKLLQRDSQKLQLHDTQNSQESPEPPTKEAGDETSKKPAGSFRMNEPPSNDATIADGDMQARTVGSDYASMEQNVANGDDDETTASRLDEFNQQIKYTKAKRTQRLENEEFARERQRKQAAKMRRAWEEDVKVAVGDLVSIKVDIRDRSQTNPTAVQGIVFCVNAETKGIKVVTEHGTIASRGKRARFIGCADYQVLDSRSALSPKLQQHRMHVQNNTFQPATYTTIAAAHKKTIKALAYGRTKCGCKKTPLCGPSCSCVRSGKSCHSGCCCGGSCSHTERLLKTLEKETFG